MGKIIETISNHIEHEMLIKIERAGIEEHDISGFPLILSEHLLVMSNIFDFHNEGFSVIRLKDITDAYSKESCAFYEQICISEGLKKRANDSLIKDATDFAAVLRQLIPYDKFVTIACELEDSEFSFSIGKVSSVDGSIVQFHYFDSMGVWEDEMRSIPLHEITRVAIGGHYANVFYRYVR